MLPLWEGYDEWAHFCVIRAVAFEHRWLPPRDQPVPRDVEASLERGPVPWEMRTLPSSLVTEDAYWTLSPDERMHLGEPYRPLGLTAYEALQPPLYYWLMTPLLWISAKASLATQVMLVRWASVLIASLAIPLIYRVALTVFEDARFALLAAGVAALMPEFAIDVARVGNECLGVVLFSLLLWMGLRGRPLALGIVLGIGLLTKAYFLTAIPAIVLLARRQPRVVFALPAAGLISGWWYLRNLLTTGTLSGLSESVQLHNFGPLELLRRGLEIHWWVPIDCILFSHIWYGAWSSLMVRAWMYHVFYALIAVAGIGLVRSRWRPGMVWLAAIYTCFWVGQFYNVLLQWAAKGIPGSMGWYLYAVVAAEVVLCIAGLYRIHPWAPAVGAILLGLLDLYTVHAVLIPYYTGMIRHRANGTIAAFHVSDWIGFRQVVERLGGGRVAVLWVAYLVATAVLMKLVSNPLPRIGDKLSSEARR